VFFSYVSYLNKTSIRTSASAVVKNSQTLTCKAPHVDGPARVTIELKLDSESQKIDDEYFILGTSSFVSVNIIEIRGSLSRGSFHQVPSGFSLSPYQLRVDMRDQVKSTLSGRKQNIEFAVRISAHKILIGNASKALATLLQSQQQNNTNLQDLLSTLLFFQLMDWRRWMLLLEILLLNSSIFSSDLLSVDSQIEKKPNADDSESLNIPLRDFLNAPSQGFYVLRIVVANITYKSLSVSSSIDYPLYSYAFLSVVYGKCTQYRACFNDSTSPLVLSASSQV